MLKPLETATRERKDLSGIWSFKTQPGGVGETEHWFEAELVGAREMAVPSSFNDIVPGRDLRGYVGDVYYQTTVRVPRGWEGERIVLRFDSATHRARVWVNDTAVVDHLGGYLPFEAHVTDHVSAGEEFRLTVKVDNRLHWDSIPPGFVQECKSGPVQMQMHDFFNYAGIHRRP